MTETLETDTTVASLVCGFTGYVDVSGSEHDSVDGGEHVQHSHYQLAVHFIGATVSDPRGT